MEILNDTNLLKEYKKLSHYDIKDKYLNLDDNIIINLNIKFFDENGKEEEETTEDLNMIVKRLNNFYQLKSFLNHTTLIKTKTICINKVNYQKIDLNIELKRKGIFFNCSIKINNNVFIKEKFIKMVLNYLFNICLEEESNLFPFKEIGYISLKYATFENHELKNIDSLDLEETSLFFDMHEFYNDFKIYLNYQEEN